MVEEELISLTNTTQSNLQHPLVTSKPLNWNYTMILMLILSLYFKVAIAPCQRNIQQKQELNLKTMEQSAVVIVFKNYNSKRKKYSHHAQIYSKSAGKTCCLQEQLPFSWPLLRSATLFLHTWALYVSMVSHTFQSLRGTPQKCMNFG